MDWEHVSKNFDLACQKAIDYVNDVSQTNRATPTPTPWLEIGTPPANAHPTQGNRDSFCPDQHTRSRHHGHPHPHALPDRPNGNRQSNHYPGRPHFYTGSHQWLSGIRINSHPGTDRASNGPIHRMARSDMNKKNRALRDFFYSCRIRNTI